MSIKIEAEDEIVALKIILKKNGENLDSITETNYEHLSHRHKEIIIATLHKEIVHLSLECLGQMREGVEKE